MRIPLHSYYLTGHANVVISGAYSSDACALDSRVDDIMVIIIVMIL